MVVGNQTEVSIEKISLPFDFYQFQKEQELYDMGEQDEMSYHPTSIEGNKELEYTYKSRWDKSLTESILSHQNREKNISLIWFVIILKILRH